MAEEKLSGAQRGKIRRLAAPHEPSPDEEAGELNIVPFLDIITNVLMFVLASVAMTFMTTLDVSSPSAGRGGGGRQPETKTLSLSVIVAPDGYSLKTARGNVAPGCKDYGTGIAVPKKADGSYDTQKLGECAAFLKGLDPAFEDETSVTIMSNPEIVYSVIVDTIDALRREPTKTDSEKAKLLFPDVMFGVLR